MILLRMQRFIQKIGWWITLTRQELIQRAYAENPFITNQDLVCEVLTHEILMRKLKGGEGLSQGRLSTDFNLSRGPVKQALEKMAKDHYLERDSVGSFFVSKPDVHLSADVFSFKKLLDLLATSQAIFAITRDGLEQLHEQLTQLNDAYRRRDFVAFCHYDILFHLLIAQIAGNFMVVETYSRYRNLFQFISVSLESDMDERVFRRLLYQHQNIFNILKCRKSDAVQSAIDAHYASLILT